MRIGINAAFRLHGGSLIHLEQLLNSWSRTGADRQHEIIVFTRDENIALLSLAEHSRIQMRTVGIQSIGPAAKLKWEQMVLPGILKNAAIDVLLCPVSIAPLRSSVPSVVAFRNAAPFCASITPSLVGYRDWLWFKSLGAAMRLSGRTARRVIFISQYFKELFVERFGFPTERGDVIYHGRDALTGNPMDDEVCRKLGVTSPYVLSVSHLYPYKNIPALIDGYALAKDTFQRLGVRLILAGKPRNVAYDRQLKAQIRERGMENWIVLTGGIPHEDIGPLLTGCEFFVFQSLCENCPNTLIEALAAGLPIACSNAGVMPEIAGDAALYFDPRNSSDIARVLKRMAEDGPLRGQLRERALRQALKFPTWDQVGQMTLRSLERAANGKVT